MNFFANRAGVEVAIEIASTSGQTATITPILLNGSILLNAPGFLSPSRRTIKKSQLAAL